MLQVQNIARLIGLSQGIWIFWSRFKVVVRPMPRCEFGRREKKCGSKEDRYYVYKGDVQVIVKEMGFFYAL